MSALTVRIHKYLDAAEARAPRVPAKIYELDSSAKSSASTGSVRRAQVPISENPAEVARLDLPPGTYYVESVLPSGETLADSVTLAEGETRDLVLRGTSSPNEWFSWQHLMGNTRPGSSANQRPGGSVRVINRKPGGTPRKKGAPRRIADGGAGYAGSRTHAASLRPGSAPELRGPTAIGRPINFLASPLPALVLGEPQGAAAWKGLAEATSANANTLATLLNQGKSALDLPVYTHDARRAVYRLSWQQGSRSEVHALEGRVPAMPRYFAVVPRRRCVELISLPMPWRVIGMGREAAIEIAVQQMHAADAFCASATALDEDLGMLLGYLSSGSLVVAREMAETARDMLYYKVENPYAAAAGGYALVGTALTAEDREWHGWIRNLMHSFPHIPDGAIQWAQLCLKMRRGPSDIEEARVALKLAYRRGLPFYSMGVKWLMEGLEWIAGESDPEAVQMLRQVQRLAWRTNFQQPFTIVRIGGDTDV